MTNTDVKTKAMSGTVWKFLERFLAQGISLIVSIVIARILSPSEFGTVSLVTIFFTFANVLISGGLNTALIQKKDADRADYSSVFWFSLIVSAVIYIVLYFLSPQIANLYKQPILTSIIRIMGLSLPVYAVKSIVCAYISSTLQFRKFFLATLGGTLFSAVVGILMAIKGFGPWALVGQQMTNTIIDTIILYGTTKVPLGFIVSFTRLQKLLSYGWKILVSSIINTTYNELTPLFIGVKYTSADLSYYTKGKLFPNTLSSTITNTFSSVMFPVMAKYQDDKERVLQYTRLFMRLASFCVFPAMLGIFAIADRFIIVLLTDKWIGAIYYLRVFCIALMFDVIAVGNCETIKAIGRSDVFLKIEIIKKISYFVVLSIFLFFSSSPKVLALASIFTMIIQIIVNSIPNSRLIDYSPKDQFIDLMPNLINSAIMCIVVMAVGRIKAPFVLVLVLQITVGIILYISISAITKNKSFLYILSNIRNRIKMRNMR